MSDHFEHVSHQSWGSRLGNSIKGILFGLLLFCGSFVLLFWNEGRAIKTAKSLAEGRGAVVDAPAEQLDANLEGKLVHISGTADTDGVLTDADFGISTPAIKLARDVEMYQWHEEKKTQTKQNTGGSSTTKTTYDYSREWSDELIDSSRFEHRAGHENPSNKPYSSTVWTAEEVRVGAYRLSNDLLAQWNDFEPFPIRQPAAAVEQPAANAEDELTFADEPGSTQQPAEQTNNETAAPRVPAGFVLRDGEFYRGADAKNPQIGDVRVRYRVLLAGPVSVIAQQQAGSFIPYATQAGRELAMLSPGIVSADAMFTSAERSNTLWTWGLRLGGFLMMTLGLSMVFAPLVTLADVLPLLGRIVGAGVMLTAGLVSLMLSLVTIAIAWLAYRPVLAVTLLIAAGASLALLWYVRRRRKDDAAAVASPQPA